MRQTPSSTDVRSYRLKEIKLLHTTIWAIMAASIVAIPWAAWFSLFRLAFGLTLLVVGECLVLAANRGRCPLTDVAARYTEERADNFDINLPMCSLATTRASLVFCLWQENLFFCGSG
jgi:hypothetical protein